MQIIFLPALIVAVQISDSYLRDFSFRDGMTDTERSILWCRFLICGIFSTTGQQFPP